MNRSPNRPSAAATTARSARGAPVPALRVLGNWQLVRPLARSQRGMVYEARPATASGNEPCEYVAKLLPDSLADDPRSVAMFRREVCVGGKVCHGHLVPVVDACLDGEPEGSTSFLVMPRVAGVTLEERLSSAGRIPWDQACWIVRQAAQALSCLHAEGWLHGDVKPSNLLVSHDGHVTLLDLGFLQPLNTLRAHDAIVHGAVPQREGDRPGSACLQGTLKYIAPETLMRAGRIMPASDIYSLGIVLYEMLSGQHPFAGATEAELVRLHLEAVPTDLRAFDPTMPEPLADLVQTMLAKDPLRRPATAEQVVRCLVPLEIAALSMARATA